MRHTRQHGAGPAAPCTAQAEDLPLEGRTTGTPFRDQCQPGAYVVGMRANEGTWLDSIQIICAPYDIETEAFGAAYPGRRYGGNGGIAFSMDCGFGEAVIGWNMMPMNDGDRWIDMLTVTCRKPVYPAAPVYVRKLGDKDRVGGISDAFYGGGTQTDCTEGQAATGIHGPR